MSVAVSQHKNFVGGEWVAVYSLEDYTQIKHVMAKID
jgi:hypothetical protein